MRIEFIGTGNAHGTPCPGCECDVCQEAQINLERRRRPPCIVVSTDDGSASLVIDAGDPAINPWLERPQTAAVLLSHFHPGHYHALLAHRRRHGSTPLYCPPDRTGLELVAANPGTFAVQELSPYSTIEIDPFVVTPVLLNHSKITYGYCIAHGGNRVAYLLDTCGLPPQTEEVVKQWKPDAVIIDCNQPPDSPSTDHNTPKQAIDIHREIGAPLCFLMHISCRVDTWLNQKPRRKPKNVEFARDGMVVNLAKPPTRQQANNAYV